MVDFNKIPFIYWSDKMKANYLQRQIIVHSIIYYELNQNVISDKKFDSISKQLIMLSKKMKSEYKKTEYYYCFKDFDGNTGFYLYDSLKERDKNKCLSIAKFVLKNFRGENNGNKNGCK